MEFWLFIIGIALVIYNFTNFRRFYHVQRKASQDFYHQEVYATPEYAEALTQYRNAGALKKANKFKEAN